MKAKRKEKTRQEKNQLYLENKDFDRLLVNNTPFIIAIAKTFHQPEQMDDLFQVGSIGLFKAFESFNHDNGNSFLAYAKQAIINQMRSYLRVNGNTVRTPVQMIRDKEPTKPCYSLNTTVGDDGATLEDFIASEVSEEENDYTALKMALMSLKDKDRILVEMYYGINTEKDPMTYKQIAEILGTSRQYIQEKIKKILNVLRNDTRLQKTQQDL